MDFFKIFRLLIILIFFSSYSHAQIESGKVETKEKVSAKKDEKTDKPKREPRATIENPGSSFYLGGGFGSSFRSLKENENIFGKQLGERANETALMVPNFSVGMRNRIKGHFFFDFSISFAKNGEQYNFQQGDSTYSYKTNFNYFAIPLKLQYVTGKKLKFIAGIGVQPQMLLNYRQHVKWTTAAGKDFSNTVKGNEKNNFFTIAALANVGLEYQIANNVSVYLMPEVRFQLNNSFQKQSPYIHKGYYIGGQVGFSFAIN